MKDSKNRRHFLKNTALSIIGISAATTGHSKLVKMPLPNLDVICDETTLDFYGAGPFYTDNPPMLQDNLLAAENEPGTRMIISGRVLNLECNEFIPETIIDVWHADDAGEYDNSGF